MHPIAGGQWRRVCCPTARPVADNDWNTHRSHRWAGHGARVAYDPKSGAMRGWTVGSTLDASDLYGCPRLGWW